MSNTGIEIKMDMGKWQEMVASKEAVVAELAQLKATLAAGAIAAVPGLAEAVQAMRDGRWAIGFGIGELHYDNVRGWPWRKLLAFVEVFERMPGIDEDDIEWAKDTRSFCEGARLREAERAGRKPGDTPTPLNL